MSGPDRPSAPVPAVEAADADYRQGWDHLRLAQVEAAVACFERAGVVYRSFDLPARVADVDDALGVVVCHLDRPAEALVLHQRAVDVYAGLDRPSDVAIAAGNAMWAALDLGDADAALRWADAALAAALAVESDDDDDDELAVWLATVARAMPLVALRRVEEAAEAADDPFPVGMDDEHLAFVNRAWARIHASRGEWEEATQHWSIALHHYRVAENRIEVRCTRREIPDHLLSDVVPDFKGMRPRG